MSYKYDPGLEESYCIKPIWSSGSWQWCAFLKAEKKMVNTFSSQGYYEIFGGDPEDADYVWVPRGPSGSEGKTYEQALAYLRKEYIEPRIERQRLVNVIVYGPFPETFEV
jgi:hypothetical protein